MATLYVVGTPIGNLEDFSPRAVRILQSVDFIAAEDTRVTLKLLNHFGIKKPMISYYEHNLRERGQMLVDRILAGENCAIVSDAGMPCVSDPGEDLVRLCAKAGIDTVVIPGPCAAVSALAVSGLLTARFTFEGFLSTNRVSRKKHLVSLMEEERTMIFYEAPHKLTGTLMDLKEAFGGERKISICHELTKIHETVFRTTLDEAVNAYQEITPKGEFVLVLEGKPPKEKEEVSVEEAAEMAKVLIQGGERPTDAAREIAKQTGCKKADIYRSLIEKSKM